MLLTLTDYLTRSIYGNDDHHMIRVALERTVIYLFISQVYAFLKES